MPKVNFLGVNVIQILDSRTNPIPKKMAYQYIMTTVFLAQAQISLPLYIFLTDNHHQAHRPCHLRAEKRSAIVRPPSAAGEAVKIGRV